jgi:hypothetical protein
LIQDGVAQSHHLPVIERRKMSGCGSSVLGEARQEEELQFKGGRGGTYQDAPACCHEGGEFGGSETQALHWDTLRDVAVVELPCLHVKGGGRVRVADLPTVALPVP